MTVLPLPEDWAADAGWLLHALDPQTRLVRLVRMDEEGYRAASFLDDRLIHPGLETRLGSLDLAIADVDSLPREDARWIFHIGHVGSTLVSRLLGELEGVLSLREPRSLRDLAFASGEQQPMLARFLRRALSRSFATDQAALIKATSSVSEQAPMLVQPNGLALFLFAAPRKYVASILAGENSLKELGALHETRLGRLRRRGIDLAGFDASPAHCAAAAWACEMTSLEASAQAMTDRQILWADFDVMLDDMSGWIERCSRHFGFGASPARFEELAAGPLMRRYSKAPEFDYSPSLRAELLAEATQAHAADIGAAMAALNQAATVTPLLNRAVKRAARES